MTSKMGSSSAPTASPSRGAVSKNWKAIIVSLGLLNIFIIAILLASFKWLEAIYQSSDFDPTVLFIPYIILALGALMLLTPALNTVIMLVFLVKQRPKGLWLVSSIVVLVASVGFLVYSDISSNKDAAKAQQDICREQTQRGHVGVGCSNQ